MLRLHGIRGYAEEAALHARLHRLEHRDGIEILFVPPEEAGRKRFRLVSDRGTDCAISLDRDEELRDGAVLHIDDSRAIVVRFGRQRLWTLRPANASVALKLGWHAGNLHWRVRFEGDDLVVLLDGPVADYRARLRELLDDGSVVERADD